MPPGLGEMWFKNGSLEPARPCCLAVWWPPFGARIWWFWCVGVKMSHQKQLRKMGFVKRPGLAFTLSLQNHGLVSNAFCIGQL